MKDKIELKQLREGWWVFSKDEFLEMVKAVDQSGEEAEKRGLVPNIFFDASFPIFQFTY